MSDYYNSFDQTMELCQLAGRIMLFSGGETYRVEDTIVRVARACGMEAESYVTPTGIFITLYKEARTHSAMIRITYRTIDLSKVSMVNEVSRELSLGNITPDQACVRLKEIATAASGYSPLISNLCAGLASGSFAYLFGGNLIDVAVAGFTGILVNITVNFLLARQAAVFLATFLAALNAGLIALIAVNTGIVTQLDKIIIGGIMPLLPGVALTNAVRDMIAGDLVAGVARAVEALLIAAAIAAAVMMVLAFVV